MEYSIKFQKKPVAEIDFKGGLKDSIFHVQIIIEAV